MLFLSLETRRGDSVARTADLSVQQLMLYKMISPKYMVTSISYICPPPSTKLKLLSCEEMYSDSGKFNSKYK